MKYNSNLKLEKLKKYLKEMKKVLIAFSGGTDSTFLLKVAHDVLASNAIAITAISSIHPKKEIEEAEKFCKENKIRQILIESHEVEDPLFFENPTNRCYYCKKRLFSEIIKIAKNEGIKFILDGSNYDDEKDYRPGFAALKELKIISPLIELKFSKKDIREISKKMKIENWDKPSNSCLASRFPYGFKISKDKLEIIEKAESYLFDLGIKQSRVRFHNNIARIEVLKHDYKTILNNSEYIIKKFKKLGFIYVTLDFEGYRSGSLNDEISN